MSTSGKVFVTFAVSSMRGYDPFNRPATVKLPVANPAVRVYSRPSCKAALALRAMLHRNNYAAMMYECETEVMENGKGQERVYAVSHGGMRIRVK